MPRFATDRARDEHERKVEHACGWLGGIITSALVSHTSLSAADVVALETVRAELDYLRHPPKDGPRELSYPHSAEVGRG